MTEQAMTPEETARWADILRQLDEAGYRPVEEHGKLRPGVRIRHSGQRWPEAYNEGTGVVLTVTEKADSSWSRSYHMADIEIVVLFDKAAYEGTSRISQLAQYHVSVVA